MKEIERPTARQQQVLDLILDGIETSGRFPTVRELAAELGVSSTAGVYKHLKVLCRKGWLTRENDRFVPTTAARRDRGLPLVGRVAAGSPITALEHIEDRLELRDLFGEGHFAVTVRGDSLLEAGILSGDLAIVREQAALEPGQTGLFYLGEEQEATLKVYRPGPQGVVLEPQNAAYEPIIVPADDRWFRIGGLVVGVLRRLS